MTERYGYVVLYFSIKQRHINKLNKATKQLINSTSRIIIPSSFAMDLECCLRQISAFDNNKCNKGVVNDDFVQAKFQADSILVFCYKNNLSYFILSINSDFQAYAGPNFVTIKAVKVYFNRKKNVDTQNSLGTFSIHGASNVQMMDLQKLLLPKF